MASGPITSWQIDGETVETVADSILVGSKITADDDCSHEIKRHLLLGRKAMTNLDSILKSKDIALPTKAHLVKAMVFPVVMWVWMWELDYKESWALKNWWIWTVVLEKTLRVPWTARKSNQSILKEIIPEYSLEGLMLKVKPQYFGLLMWRTDSFERLWCWERLKVGGEGDDRGWDGLMASQAQWTQVWVNSGTWWWTGRPGMLQSIELQRVGHDWLAELNYLNS